ncbi:transpeptidase family protein [bacterium]|nr:transpeptidase family protein [bacterium]
MQNNKNNQGQNCSTHRIVWLGGSFTLITVCILFRLFYIQVLKPDPWRSMAPAQYESRMRLQARRGMIYDRQKNLLAMDLPGYSLAADPTLVIDIEKTAQAIASVLNGSARKYSRLLETNKTQYVRITPELSETQRHELESLKIPGLIITRKNKRTYPFDLLARSLIGLTDARHEGVSGVELSFNDILSGQDGWTILQRDGLNRNFTIVDYPVEPALNGRHVVLTLDYVLQTIIEEELQRGLNRYQARWGSAVLMHPVTGDVLAMVSLMGPQLQKENPDLQTTIRNRAIQDNYEPGSVFKIVTLAAALQEKIVTPQSLIYCENGNYQVDGNPIHDDNRSYQWLTVAQAMQVSSNIALSKIAKKLGKKVFYRYIQDFGFGNRTGIGLPGEASGLLRPPYQWDDFLTATTAFGQGLSVTTLQLACMTTAIANGGELLKPRIYQYVLDEEGRRIEACPREVIRRVVSEETAREVARILESSISEGTGIRAAVPGLRIAGKTGTAQKSVPDVKGYVPGAYESSFVGFWPVQSPEYVLAITLDEPRQASFSSQSAAPIFANIAECISGLTRNQDVPEPMYDSDHSVFTLSGFEALQAGTVTISFEKKQAVSPYFVPDMAGLSLRQSMRQLALCGIQVQIQGHGIVKKQSLKPGIRVKENMVCELVCE